jgi:hypothetical protein
MFVFIKIAYFSFSPNKISQLYFYFHGLEYSISFIEKRALSIFNKNIVIEIYSYAMLL